MNISIHIQFQVVHKKSLFEGEGVNLPTQIVSPSYPWEVYIFSGEGGPSYPNLKTRCLWEIFSFGRGTILTQTWSLSPDRVYLPDMSGPVQLLILLTESFNIKLPLCQRQVQNFPKMGGTNPKVETPAYYLAKFCRKMHENGENWTGEDISISHCVIIAPLLRGEPRMV